MTEMEIPAAELVPGDQIWARKWFATGDQPDDVNGWFVVLDVEVSTGYVKVGIDRHDGNVTKGPGDLHGLGVTHRLRTDRVRVRRAS